jgi:hypothetical protein
VAIAMYLLKDNRRRHTWKRKAEGSLGHPASQSKLKDGVVSPFLSKLM